MKKYPEEQVVTEYATWEGSRGEFLAKYAIPNTTLHQWLHAYHKPVPSEERQLAARAVHIYRRARVYLCVIVDIFARKVVGFQFGVRNCTRLVVRTFLSAYESRKPSDGLVFHSDRGSANLSRRFMDCLKAHNVIQSASRPHTPQDNAVIESFFRNLKAEIINPCQYRSQREMVDAVKHWLETYNAKRPHTYNRGKTPNDAENEFFMHSKDIQD